MLRHKFLTTILGAMMALTANAGETIKVLAIGNSFSVDAVENYLSEMARADGITLIIGNLYIGGCSLARHWKNADGDLPEYSYRKIGADGIKTTTENYRLSAALADDQWDVITFQQVSQDAGRYATYFPFLPDLMQYVQARATNPQVKFFFHQTWAYAENSTHGGFANYDRDQIKMYRAIVETVRRVCDEVGLKTIIPSGAAIQNGRAVLGDIFCRDGFHLDWGLGRFTAAATWYEQLTGRAAPENSYRPENLSAEQTAVAKEAAHHAVTARASER
jgi:hypothetical protein